MKSDDYIAELGDALSYFTVEELQEEIDIRRNSNVELDNVDKRKIDEIIAVFYAANWFERELIYKNIFK